MVRMKHTWFGYGQGSHLEYFLKGLLCKAFILNFNTFGALPSLDPQQPQQHPMSRLLLAACLMWMRSPVSMPSEATSVNLYILRERPFDIYGGDVQKNLKKKKKFASDTLPKKKRLFLTNNL